MMHVCMLLLSHTPMLRMNESLLWQTNLPGSMYPCPSPSYLKSYSNFCCSEVMRVLRKLRPDHKFIDDFSDEKDRDLSTVPNQRGAELLKRMGRDGYTSLEETITDSINGL